jgi:palmitoyl-protein thioesterase
MLRSSAVLSTMLLSLSDVSAHWEHKLGALKERIKANPVAFAEELRNSEFAQLAPEFKSVEKKRTPPSASNTLPLVFLHGMGDSCFNNGMQSITKDSGEYLGVYSVCIPTGDTRGEDTMNGFILSMDENVDVFAEKVQTDPLLANGFNCIGLSQGNNICRGYIQKYNSKGPSVNTHLSIHGPIVGVAALPHCYPDGKHGTLCQDISDLLGKMAYNEPMQDFLFQADYFRDVNMIGTPEYKTYSEMGQWNNEGDSVNSDIKLNFGLTKKYAMIKANEDSVVVPREGEWWGAFDSDYETILTMKETAWYKEDLFGLRTADEAGKIFFNSTDGNHLDFSMDELYGWLDLYIKE